MTVGPTTMTAQNVLDHVKRQFGDEAGVQVTDQDIFRWINTGQLEILNKNPVLKARATTTIIKGTGEYLLPNDVHSIQSLRYDGVPIEYVNYQTAQEQIDEQDPKRQLTGTPFMWFEWAGTLTLYPTPDKDLTDGLVIDYYRMPTSVIQATDSLSIPDRYYNSLVHYVMQQAYEMDEDWVASGNKASQFEASVNTLANEENYIERKTYPVITVLPEDGW